MRRLGRIDPSELGLDCDELDDLAGGEPAENAGRFERLLAGRVSTVERCAVLLNAAAALYVSGTGLDAGGVGGAGARGARARRGARVLERLRPRRRGAVPRLASRSLAT